MAAELDRLAKDFGRHPRGNSIAEALRGLAGVARQLGVPESFETPQPRDIKIPTVTVSEEVYNRTLEAVERLGYNFVVSIRPLSIGNLLVEDGQREQGGKSRRLGYVNDSGTMRATVPPEMEIAINPTRLRIEGSNNLSTERQKAMIGEEEARLKEQLPSEVRPVVSMCMVDPSTLSQLEDVYMDKTGNLLFPNYFGRTDVETSPGRVAFVGRSGPTSQRHVLDWYRDAGLHSVFAVSVVVLPRKLSV